MSLGENMDDHMRSSRPHEESTSSIKAMNDIQDSRKNRENVAVKSTEANVLDPDDNTWFQAGKMVKDWESAHHHFLRGTNKDIALKAAYTQLTQKRGIVRADLQRWYNYNSNYARRKIYLLLQKELG